jgi:uncharacterized protein (TIGR03089 family)
VRTPQTPSAVLSALLRTDPGRPRITCYDDTPGPSQGERIELSARVLANWVSKAANLLQEEWEVEPGAVVRLALPPHWRSLYWALAVWSVGACVSLDDGPAGALVTDDPGLAAAGRSPTALVTLAGLARSAPGPVPPGVFDEAKELSTYADQFSPWGEPSPRDPALRAEGALTAYDSVVPQAAWPAGTRLHTATESLQEFLLDTLAALAIDGSVVLSRGPAGPGREARLGAEGVTLAL